MSNFNEYFRKRGCKYLVDKFIDGVHYFSTTHRITRIDYKIIEGEEKASYYLENDLTAVFTVEVEYDVTHKDRDGKDVTVTETTSFEVPKEIEGAFIVEGAYKVSTNRLGSDYDCRFRTTGSGSHTIAFEYSKVYNIDKKTLDIKVGWGAAAKTYEITRENIENYLNDPEKRELLKLTEYQSKKLQVKLDLPYKPEYITLKLIDECIAFGDDRVKDLICDKTIESVPQRFINYIFRDGHGQKYYSTRKKIALYFVKNKKINNPLTAISTLCLRFLKGGLDNTTGAGIKNDIQVPPGVNALNLESLRSKIVVDSNVAINTSMLDLIDVADTPINNNGNKQNALTVSTHLVDTDNGTEIHFDVYDKDFKKIQMVYLDYLNSKVVASESVDYENKKLILDQDGKVWVKYRMKKIKCSPEEIDLIDLHPDYRLSQASRRIPFYNFTDSVRCSMGSQMAKQTMAIANAQRPLVDTGNVEELSDNIMNEKFMEDVEGKVTEINDDFVIIKLPGDRGEKKFPRRTALQGVNDVDVFTEPKVKVGQKVKKGDIITGAVEVGEDTIKLGANATVLYHAFYGLVNEDAVVISESFADKMLAYQIIDVAIDIKDKMAIKWIAPIGTEVKSKDQLLLAHKTAKLDEVNTIISNKLNNIIDEALGDISNRVSEVSLLCPNNIEKAVVSDVRIQENVNPYIPKTIKKPDLTFAHTSREVMDAYDKAKDRKIIYKRFPEYIAADTLDDVSLEEKTWKTVYTVRIRLIKYSKPKRGEKITNRYGGKGVISEILPDERMPILVDKDGIQKRVEAVMNPYSTIGRKIPSVIMEVALTNIITKIHDNVDAWKTTAAGRKKAKAMVDKYYGNRYKDLSPEEFIKLHNTMPIEEVYYMNVGSFSSYTPEKLQKWMDELGVSTESKVLIPEKDVTDLDELKENLSEEEFEETVREMEGKMVEVEKPLMAGNVNLIRLYHQPQYSNKCATDMSDRQFMEDTISGLGKYRKGGGQMIGEMELSALLARNVKPFINSSRSDESRVLAQTFLDNLLGLGLTIQDGKGYAMGGSNLKKSINNLKNKYRLKGGLDD